MQKAKSMTAALPLPRILTETGTQRASLPSTRLVGFMNSFGTSPYGRLSFLVPTYHMFTRRLAQDLSHPLITMLQQECTRATCPEMKAGEWMYLCVAHGNDGAMEVSLFCFSNNEGKKTSLML